MDTKRFNRSTREERLEYFYANQGDAMDSLETLNFDYFLFRDQNSDMIFELKVGRKIDVLDVKAIYDFEILKKYPPGHKKADNQS